MQKHLISSLKFFQSFLYSGCVKFLSPVCQNRGFRGLLGFCFRITDFAEDAEKTAAINRIAEITLIRCYYDLRLVSYQRTPRHPRFRTQRKYEIPKL